MDNHTNLKNLNSDAGTLKNIKFKLILRHDIMFTDN